MIHDSESRRERPGFGPALRPGPAAGPAVPPAAAPAPGPLVAPAGYRLAAPAEVLTGAALVGQAVLYRWPTEGWHRGPPHPGGRVHARGALRTHVGARVGGDALASRWGLARPGRALVAPPACALAWLPFSRTPVMARYGLWAGRDSEHRVLPRQTDAVDQFRRRTRSRRL